MPLLSLEEICAKLENCGKLSPCSEQDVTLSLLKLIAGGASTDPAPIAPDIEKIRICKDGTWHIQICRFTFDASDPTAPPVKDILDEVDTGEVCNTIEPLVVCSECLCDGTTPVNAPVVGDPNDLEAKNTWESSLSGTFGNDDFSSYPTGTGNSSLVGTAGPYGYTLEHRDFNLAAPLSGTLRSFGIENPISQNGASLPQAGVETVGGGTTTYNSFLFNFNQDIGAFGACLLDVESSLASGYAKISLYDAAWNLLESHDITQDGSDVTRFWGISRPENDIRHVSVSVGDVNGGSLQDQLALTLLKVGILDEATESGSTCQYKKITTLEEGVLVVKHYATVSGLEITDPIIIDGLRSCEVEIEPVEVQDHEYVRIAGCNTANDENIGIQYHYINGVLQSSSPTFYDMQGEPITAPANWSLGFCVPVDYDFEDQKICIDGTTPGILRTYTENNIQVAQEFRNMTGPIAAPANWEFGSCPGELETLIQTLISKEHCCGCVCYLPTGETENREANKIAVYNNLGAITGYIYTDTLTGAAVSETLIVDCCADDAVTACIEFEGFDGEAPDFWEVGETSTFSFSLDSGPVTNLVVDTLLTYAAPSVASGYQAVFDYVNNNVAGWTMSIGTDTADGKPILRLEYSGMGASSLVIEKGGDIYTFNVDSAGQVSGGITDDQLEPFSSQPLFGACGE